MKVRTITRTIKTITVNCLRVDLTPVNMGEKPETAYQVLTIRGDILDGDILRYIQNEFDNDTQKTLAVVSFKRNEKLYEMAESDFIKYARPVEN